MGSISKLTTALASATSELTLAAANLNVDFSLVKFEAPQEYLALGQNLSKKRREDAELGSIHATAGKLAALFSPIIPRIPNLARAYGIRVSEISSSPLLNPQVSRSGYGIFADSVGVDATSIWAAATSGPAAVPVHLLGCMLARHWSANEAISIWVEVVAKRKIEIAASIESNDSVLFETYSAARQELTRSHLADWDSSARAWLESADEVYKVQNRQLRLILDNINLPVDTNLDPYQSVMAAWNSAMSTLENLIIGMPQRAQDAAALLALSAWHIYPDLLALGSCPTPIEMNDKLVEKGGTLTIGLTYESPDREEGISWALSLAHLRYYGDPTTLSKSLTQDGSRISFNELTIVALGSLVWAWGGKQADTIKIAEALVVLWEALTCELQGPSGDVIKNMENPSAWRRNEKQSFSWVGTIAEAASDLLSAQGDERRTAQRLVGSGFRNGRSFLVEKHELPHPCFGLCGASTLRGVLNSKGQRELDNYINESSAECGKDKKDKSSDVPPTVASHISESIPGLNKASQAIYVDGSTSTGDYFPINKSEKKRGVQVHQEKILPMTHVLDILKPDTIDPWNVQVYFTEYFKRRDYQAARTEPKSSLDRLDVGSRGILQSLHALSLAARLYKLLPGATVAIKVISNSLSCASYYSAFFSNRAQYNTRIASYRFGETLPSHMDKVDIRPTCLRGVARPKSEVSVDAAKYWFEHESVVNYEHLCASFAMAFSCLALFDSGHLQINTEDLSNVIAMSTGNSIYVASPLLCDPSQEPVGLEMKRIIGNIGKPGIAMLVPPLNLRVRAPDPTSWRLVAHDDFDGKSYDRFAQTSMQLSLSGREQGLRLQNYGLCDKQVILLESVISVYDRGKWIADVDVLRALRPKFKMTDRPLQDQLSSYCFHMEKDMQPTRSICRGCRGRGHSELCRNDSCSASTGRTIGEQPEFRKIAIDCWEELLEAPEDACVVRAHGNWIGRLAATCVAYQMGRHVSILPEDVCWKCVDKLNKDQQDVVFIS